MPTARSSTASGRLRSKTTDLSDFLRGGRSHLKQPEPHLTPAVAPPPPPAEPTTPPKGKRRIEFPFLGRKRKSSSVSPSSIRRSQDVKTDQEGDIPPVPSVDANRLLESTAIDRRSSSAPSSPQTSKVPPRSGPSSYVVDTHKSDPAKPGSAIPIPSLRYLRAQKSTSFEHTRRSTEHRRSNDSSHQSSTGARPIITISAPPPIAEDRAATPRATAPPAVAPRTARRQFGTPHDHRNPQGSPQTSPTSPRSKFTTPAAEYARSQMSSMEVSFPRASKEYYSRAAPDGKQSESESQKSGLPHASKPHKQASALPLSLPRFRDRSSSLAFRKVSASDSGMSDSDTTPSSPTSLARSRIPATVSALRNSSGKTPPPLLTTFRKPPSSGPPTDPLPSPPPSAGVRSGDESSSSLAAIPTIPSMSSVGARRSGASFHQGSFRERANTASSLASSHAAARDRGDTTTPTATAPPSPTDWSEAERYANKPLPPLRDPQESGDESAFASALGEVATPEQLRDALNAQSAKFARLSAYLLTLTERHAAEKSELTRRIEALEREARKREREITGLRWLVMNSGTNAACEPGAPARTVPQIDSGGRFRSGSKSSQQSQGSQRGSPGEPRGPTSVDSHVGSMEEGLIELQKCVSDFIAPAASLPGAEMGADPSPNLSVCAVTGRLRRSNTLPDGLAQLPVVSATQKQARHTSSPIMPPSVAVAATAFGASAGSIGGAGLGMDLPSIPSLPGSDSGRMPSARSSFSLPSLTATNTASSGLSAIPESPRTPGIAGVEDSREQEKRAKEERRASRALKRLSASTTSSSMSASTAYSSSLKLSSSPSIGQVLDQAPESDSDMDVILRRLQAFGSDRE